MQPISSASIKILARKQEIRWKIRKLFLNWESAIPSHISNQKTLSVETNIGVNPYLKPSGNEILEEKKKTSYPIRRPKLYPG
jgi:hypothetical protein